MLDSSSIVYIGLGIAFGRILSNALEAFITYKLKRRKYKKTAAKLQDFLERLKEETKAESTPVKRTAKKKVTTVS